LLTPYQAKYTAHDLTLQHAGGGIDRLSQALFNASVDLNPHQIEAAVFALHSPLIKGVLLADEAPSSRRPISRPSKTADLAKRIGPTTMSFS
jgi:hypothetical protein